MTIMTFMNAPFYFIKNSKNNVASTTQKIVTFRVIKGNMMSQSQIAELVHNPWVIICQSLLHLFELLISLFAFPLYVPFSSKSRNFFTQRNFLSQSQVILKLTNFFLSVTMLTTKQVLTKIRTTQQSVVMGGRPIV